MLSANPQVSHQDTALTYLPEVRDGYVAYEPTNLTDALDLSVNAYATYNRGDWNSHVAGNFSVVTSTIASAAPTRYQRRDNFLQAGVSLKVAPWLEPSLSYLVLSTGQVITPESAPATEIELINHQPSLELSYRGKQLSIGVDNGVQFGTGLPTLYVLGVDAQYRHPTLPLELSLRANDLLNYDRSTFRTVAFSPGNLRATTYERLPGYVALLAKYTWGRAE